jgi:hypothetical protein
MDQESFFKKELGTEKIRMFKKSWFHTYNIVTVFDKLQEENTCSPEKLNGFRFLVLVLYIESLV